MVSSAPKDAVRMNFDRNSGVTTSAFGSVHCACFSLSRISMSVNALSACSAPSALFAASLALKFATSASSSALSASWSVFFLTNFSVGGRKQEGREGQTRSRLFQKACACGHGTQFCGQGMHGIQSRKNGNAAKKYSFFLCGADGRGARTRVRGVPRAVSTHRVTARSGVRRACGERRSRWGGAWGGIVGQNPCGSVGGTPGRTVDDESKRDGVHQDHHGHRSLAFTLGAFGTGVMDKGFIRSSEKGAHVCHRRYVRGDVRCGSDVHLVGASVLVGLNPILG